MNVSTGAVWVKAIGALGGAVISAAIWVPNSWRDGVARVVVGVIGGYMFGPVVQYYAAPHLPGIGETDMLLASSGMAAAIVWPAFGAAYRIADTYKPKGGQ